MSFDVISALCSWLPGRVGAPCSSTVPASPPDEFVTVERTGGAYSLGRDEPNLAVQCWAADEAEAYVLALAAREALLLCWQEIPEVCRAEVGSIYSFPDPDTRRWRYQLDVYLVTRP